ncbi:hypothetical protein GCM10007173_31910 [Glutamicibacter ardleyensis]|uniref:Uncharacterized protein n=2 Tax=Glutamicibacter ardleyensis TaxID=225894 RepID=A0ABQ2DVT1_9MICC|nr:hypothetical protein GCM10007173_31910 [Glutamicibacter ardleyensis]
MSPPFFAGRGVQPAVASGPLISFSDPIVESDSQCSLSWYAGSSQLDVPQLVSKTIDALTDSDDRDVWMMGGSGGGFAALNIAHAIKRPISVLVWNPQSAIDKYNPKHVRNYFNSAYPELVPSEEEYDVSGASRKIADATGRSLDLSSVLSNGSSIERILVLQNYNDWHIIPHTTPLVEALDMKQCSPGIFSDGSGSRIAWFTELGEGHAAPETTVLVKLIRAIYNSPGERLLNTVALLDSGELFPVKSYKSRPLDCRKFIDFISENLELKLFKNSAAISSDLFVVGQHRITYRFSLVRAGELLTQSDWIARMDWPMYRENTPQNGDIVTTEVRDGFGHILFTLEVRFE